MTTGFEEKTMEEEEEEKSSSGATTTNNNGLFVSLPHGEIVRAAVPDGGLLFMVGEGGQAWIRLNDNNDEGGVTNGGAPLRLRAVPHALVLPWQQQEQKMQEMGAKQQPTEWWRAWHGRMFLPPSDALVSSAPSSSSASSSSSSTAMVPFSDFRAAQIRLVLADHTNQEEEDAHLSPTLGCGLLGTAPLANAAISASAAPAQHQQEQQQPSTSFLRALMDPMDDDGGCGEGEVLCWMQCMEASSLVCGPGTQPECVDTVTNTVVSGEVTCPSGIDFCEPLCAVPLPSGQQEGTAFCSGGGTDMYMDGFNSWLGNGDEKLLCLNLLFSSWTLNRKWKVALACLGTLALAIVSEFLGKLRRLANKARLVRAADRQQQQTMTTTRLAVGSGGNKYNFMGAHGEEEGRVENGSGDGHEKTMLSPWAAACLDDLGMASLYAVQVAMGYFLMLIAMTYQAELFCCVILGLSAGHALFSLQEPPSANTDPCCVGREDGLDDNTNGNNNTNTGGGGGFRWDGGEGHVETKDEQDQLKGVASSYSPKSSVVVVAGGQQGAGGSGGTMYHETVRLEVGGMTCSSCVSTVKAALERLPNVRAARVGLPNGSARLLGSAEVDCEGAGLAAPAGLPQELAATVESVGFEARAVVRCA
jgi:copper chaperone CopZ